MPTKILLALSASLGDSSPISGLTFSELGGGKSTVKYSTWGDIKVV